MLITPITLTSYDVGLTLALKGFAAAMLGAWAAPRARWPAAFCSACWNP
nr:hypothetical protein [Bordetella parapertussis]